MSADLIYPLKGYALPSGFIARIRRVDNIELYIAGKRGTLNKHLSKWEKLKGLVHDNAHELRLSLQNKFVGSTLNSKSPLPVQSLKILRFIRRSVALAGLVILR